MTDVCLILMPYASIELPSIGLGILKSCLRRAEIETKILYPNLQFAEEIGVDTYRIISMLFTETLLGEWTFSSSLFPDFQPEQLKYLSFIDSKNYRPINLSTLQSVRKHASFFIDSIAKCVLDSKPRLVGCSSTFQQHCASLALLKRIREIDPNVITFIGGANCEGSMGIATKREFPWVD